MKVRILKSFHDINNYAQTYEKGTLAEFSDPARVANLIDQKLVEQIPAICDEVAAGTDGDRPKRRRTSDK